MNKAILLLGVFVFCSASAEDCKDKKAPAFTQDLKDAHDLCNRHNSGYDKGFEKCTLVDIAFEEAKAADEKARLNVLLKDHPEWLE